MNIVAVLLILLAGVVATYAVGNKWAKHTALAVSVLTLLSSVCMLSGYLLHKDMGVQMAWIQNPSVFFAFRIDGLALALTLLTTVLSPIIILTSWTKDIKNARTLYALILFMEMAMLGTFTAGDGLLYYVFWELSLLPIYFIVMLWGNGEFEKRKRTVITFFVYTFAGSLFMLMALIYLYTQSGDFLLSSWYNLRLPEEVQNWVFAGFFLAYAIKIPLIPFHSWQASTYQKAPAFGTMLLSGIMLKMGLYSVLRWQLPIAPQAAENFKYVLIALSLAGVVYGAIITLRQRNIKRFLAFSSLSHVGLIAAGAYTLTADGLQGAVLQMLAHGLVIVGLFYVADIIFDRLKTANIDQMGGIRAKASWFNTAFLMLVLASVSLPLTFNFVGEFTVLYSLLQVNTWFAVMGGLTIILGAFYMLRMFQQVMLGEANKVAFADLKGVEILTLSIIIGLILVLGIFPKPLIDLITPSVQEIASHIQTAIA